MAEEEGLFGKYKHCSYCGRPLSKHYEADLCPRCLEAQLFRDVKEYIRSNYVNEYEVAQHFKIPLKQVKEWIREGRIEYRTEDPALNVASLHCQNCGAPISFGTLCPKCLKSMNSGKGYSFRKQSGEDSRMRFLDNDKKS
ncbi:MAG: FeoC-like transcriptional regulator [Blautia sp.]|nr:FeoC-like transcriptional regulator [Blautia sp.]